MVSLIVGCEVALNFKMAKCMVFTVGIIIEVILCCTHRACGDLAVKFKSVNGLLSDVV